MAPYRFSQQQQPAQRGPHVEIRSPETRLPDLPAVPTNNLGTGISSLAQALADRKMQQDAAADPWSGLRDARSPFEQMRDKLGQLFGPRF